MIARCGLAAVLALMLLAPGASAAEWKVTGRTAQGPVSFEVVNHDWAIYSHDFRFRTRCGTVRVPGKLYWWETQSVFSYRSADARTALWIYNDTSPDGGGHGWVRTERRGCASGHLKVTLDGS